MRAAALWIPGSVRLNNSAVYQPDEPFQVAGFTVTPYSVDHSAFDSYALLVKAGDKKVFYSGDFRNSGYASYKTKKLLKNPPKDVDALLMEGTTIGSDTHGNVPEESLTNRICNAVKDDTGLVFLAASSQNIDRLVTAIKAANRLNRRLVIDNYAYSVLMATGIKSITGALSRVKVFIHRRQRLKIMRDNLFAERPPGRMRLFEDDLVAEQEKYILLYRFAHIETFKYAKLKNPLLIYSMWNGYFDRDEAIKKFIAAKGIRLEHIHTSGHADIKTLQSLAKAVKPKILIPVHTENPGKYTELFDNVKITKELEL
jgi:ribonuclease J